MNTYFKEIFEYHHHFNLKILDQLIENEEKASVKSIKLFSHILNAHQIWNSRILGFERFDVFQLHALDECEAIERKNYRDTLKILKEFDLTKKITYTTSKGHQFSNTIQDILFHVSNHTSHHRGQLVSQLKNKGITPLVTDFIFYKRKSLS
ncbi:MAG: DinB family protein [Chitinophagales bacterium]